MISLSLMVLLTVLAVGLLGLSTISLRSSSTGLARAEAQANARLALMLAIGELQTSLGPDQGISARASSIVKDAAEPNLVGAWQSWRWVPGTTAPNYSDKADKFRGWLVSTRDSKDALSAALPGSELSEPVWMVNPATVGVPQGTGLIGPELRASKVAVQTSESRLGTFAWAVMDESQKAPIQLEDREPTTDGERIAQRIAPGRARPEDIVASLAPVTLGDPQKVVSLNSAVVAVGKDKGQEILSRQSDITSQSVGLLTNTVEGGLKTDLTTLFESTNASPNVNSQVTLYNTVNDGAPRWDYLRSHYQLNRRVSSTAQGTPKVALNSSDLAIVSNGLRPSPTAERLLPVIAKLQVMFSVVSHYNHIQDRVDFYNNSGNPKGNTQYGVPHLAYDPVITLYNPYDVALDVTKLRVRIWDPPVVFGMKKNGAWLRDDYASGNFHGLSRFQIDNQFNTNARRYFTFLLTDMRPNLQPGNRITLQPGEVKVFSPWVERDWSWAKETADPWNPRSFFDWRSGSNFGNRDNRTGNTYGIETVPGWDPRAGLQVDHLTYSDNRRPASTLYDFENPARRGDGWMAIKVTDTFGVEARPGRTVTVNNQPDFVVDLLAGQKVDTNNLDNTAIDMLRTYRFKMGNPVNEISSNPANPTIKRNFRVGQILQTPTDKSVGGKSPFAILSMTAKTTKTALDYSMPWLHNHPVVEGAEQTSTRIGNALDSYDLRFEEVTDFNTNPGGIELDPGTNRGFYGATSYSQGGVSNVPMFRVPLLPAASLGDLVSANLVSSSHLPRVTHAFGNSRAHPLIPSSAVSRKSPTDSSGLTIRTQYDMLDHSYLINDALWDSTYFSTVANFTNTMVSSGSRQSLLEKFLDGQSKLLNPRFIPMLQGDGSPKEKSEQLNALNDEQFAKRIGSVLAIQGPFNVNSDSVGAWKAMLASMRDAELKGWTLADMSPDKKTGFPRFGLPIAGDPDGTPKSSGIDVAGTLRWAGFRALTDEQIDILAINIVEQIRERGSVDRAPSLSLGEFVNRRLGSGNGLHVLAGLLQTAIDRSKINDKYHALDSKDLGASAPPNPAALTNIANPLAREGKSAEGAPSLLTQGDLLMALAPVITVRGDTFRIRSYGESKAKDGKVEAKAWCEAIVQRTPDYLDSSEEPELKTVQLTKETNIRFGRRFVITSFRWLSPEEV
ncbi:hypothetical protein OKA05_26555 [Luteolibacter arcticus]|uniref:Verru_Chthon cassette protein A n=1 Tax=Luteolibacter arcticus TaxID=1581411 RepID=A0ABT3GRQ7_9BACT|nr:hypothetical protein [Luteolibacter arcticus]MCW1926148.1 hypothetical protein [Luteolibacter arcticus]